ncbi:Uncharacterized conserved protein, DUF1330 family [Pseudovibrio ascidiaceicola]|uniref:Uncharacterized conserved protein, DUF1330 family n=1 Tax=Pseudovibrio ascidiaceicola TaxID=285279 RepID=A0A1I4DTH0_9HYPH|nr:DUF1330 domain-containing protein [Pseudovibrio ascidiaceicola]SFK95960.1 Uncharacterized conserved protein, DUF1330 family [Pseudovibrio ascidiaceicola]
MPKAYWIAHVTVTDADAYTNYTQAAPAAFQKYGARFLARGGKTEHLEGTSHPRNVVIEFDTMEQALACYHSPEYQEAKSHRKTAALADIMIVEGIE